jgi:DNA mismatch endonuclease (patch repair protein)
VVQRTLATLGWHCITVWECQLKPKVRERTLESLAFTLNHIFLTDRRVAKYRVGNNPIDYEVAADPGMDYIVNKKE